MKTRLLSLLLVILASVMPMKLWAADGNAEPYAVLSDNDTKLTFYYDDQREARGGMSVAGSFAYPDYQPWHSQAVSITSAEFDPSFANCTTLTSTRFWFYDCKNMGAIFGIQYLKTDNVTDMWGMFGGCSGLTSLDLSGFNTANVKSMGSMFEGCSGLTKIFAGDDWNTALVTDGGSMFSGCTSLVGGAGTAYDANHTDHTYAHIDGGTANPGYFTAKDGQDDPLLARLYDNLALTTTDGNADGGNNDLSGSIDAAQTSLVRAMWNLQELPTDESYCVWMDSGIPALNTNTWSNSTQTQSMMGLYARLYHGIILANNYLANQNDGDLGKQAEARFLRALQYYYLMDHFGNVPLLTDTIDRQPLPVWEATPRDIELPTRVEMFNYIESELQDCLNSLPAANSYGRATTTAARLLLARLYLNSEVYTGTARWQEARSYAESVINGGTFQLAPIYRNLFMGDNDSNGAQQEIILPAIYDANTRTDYGGTTFLVASSFANGEGDNGTTQVWAGNVSKPDFVNKFFTQTADIPYASPEQTASAANDDRALFYGINHSYELRNGDSFSDGFPYQKFTNVRSNGTSPVSSKFADTDFPLMRLGEAYLIAAEADARLNGSATSMQGTQYINMLRNRANAAASTTGYSLSDICDEWSREMGYEAVRRTTLIRFGRFGGQADYSWAWKGGSYDGSAFDAAKNTYPIPAVAVGGTPEPYAVLSDNNTKLTFFYDDQKAIRDGMRVGPFGSSSDVPWYSERESITSAEFDSSFADCTTLTSTVYWFYECKNMVSISGIEYLKTDNVTNMYCMFYGCSGLTSLDVSHFNTEKVTNMSGMFDDCSSLTSLDLSHFNTDKVTTMTYMFEGCSGLTSLDLSSFNTVNVTKFTNMFKECSNLKTIYVGSGWSTANVAEGTSMFYGCTNLVGGAGTPYDENHTDYTYAHIDGGASNPGYFTANNERVINGKFVTTDYTSFAYALEDNGTVIEITDNDIVDDSEEPGNRCIKIVSKDNATENWDSHFIIRIGEPLKEGQTYKFSMRAKASRNVSISSQARTAPDQYLHYRMLGNFDLTTGWQPYNVEGVVESEQAGCTVIALLLNVDKSSAEYYFDDISFRVNEAPSASPEPYAVLSDNNTKLTFFYDTEKDARGGMSVGPFTETYDSGRERWKTDSGWDEKRENITTVVFDDSFANCTTLTSTAYWFYYCNNLTAISGISSLKTDNVTNMNSMFAGCSSLTSIDVTGFNTDKVTDMCNMFGICSSLKVLDVSRFNTSNVTDMSAMFYNCSSLTNLDVANFNTSKVTNMSYMFRSCSGLTGLDLTNFNTANVTEMSGMFYNCSGLTTLDVSGLNTANVTNMHSMFDSCSRLASLNVSSFNTANVTDMGLMFSACYELTSLDVSGFNTDNVTDMHGMFGGSSGLTSLDLSNFKTDKVTTMFLMFEGCLGLTSLDLSSFNTENVTKFTNMFKECSNLKTIYVGSGWSTANVAEGTSMFFGCTNLVGGAGTAYDENHVDHTYAHIDGGTSNPGYFTAKNAPEGEATFDGKVARVSGERTLDEAFEQRGGRAEATRTIAAIIWNKESALTESDLQGITNPNLLVYVNDASLAPSNVQNVVINGMAREIVLTDAQDGNNDWYAPQAFVAERISYTRNFTQSTTKGTSRGWESIALPFDVQTIQHESKGVIAPFNSSASNKHFWLRRLTDNGLQAATNIEANTPYIISMPNSEEYTSDYNLNGRVTFSAQNIDVPATTTKVLALADSSIVMIPTMQRQSRSSAVWALNVGEVRGQYFEGSVFERDYRTVRPFEAYTIHRQENGQPAPRYVPIQEIGGTTGIEEVESGKVKVESWYDLEGRKLEGKPARKGVYISNGKKVVVK